MNVKAGHVCLFFAFAMIAGSLLVAQTPTGSISGSVSDSTGAQIAGATVRIINTKTHETHTTSTGTDGAYICDPAIGGSRTRAQQIAQFFNTAAFAKTAAGVLYGNSGRNNILGPNAVTWNAAAMKDFRLREGKSLQFRTDFFNALNQVNLGNPNTTLSNGNFGKVTSAAAPRMLQFGLKLYF
jgi:hypothetical protein